MVDVLARSPVAGVELRPLAALTLAERRLTSLVQVAAFPDSVDALAAALAREGFSALPSPTSSFVANGAVAMDVGPGRVLIDADRPGLFAALEATIPSDVGTVTDLSHARVCLTVEGPRAAWVLAKGVAIDLDKRTFGVGRVAVTEVDHVGVILRRTGANAFALYPYRGFARSLLHFLHEAGAADGR